MEPQVRTGAPPGTRTPNPRIKSPLLCSRASRYYLRLYACTSEDMSRTCTPSYQTMTAATGLYRRIRASTEQARDRIGLDQSDEMRQSRPGIPAWRTCACRKPMPPGDTHESRLRRGLAAGGGSGPGQRRHRQRTERRGLVQGAVRPVGVVEVLVLAQG